MFHFDPQLRDIIRVLSLSGFNFYILSHKE